MEQFELIQNNNIDILINKKLGVELKFLRKGAELVGFKIHQLQNGILYRDGDVSEIKSGWKNHATILFPVVGRLKNMKSLYKDKIIYFDKNHGFARNFIFKLEKYKLGKNKASVYYLMESNENSKKYYPFDFKFYIIYKIFKNKLKVVFKIKNKSKNEPMYFSLGWHPGFAVYDKYSIKLKSSKFIYYKINDNGLLTGEKKEIHKDYFYKLISGDLNKALIFKLKEERKRSLIFNNGRIDIKIKFRDFPFLGIWSEDKNKFICIEPWHGVDDFENQTSFDKKMGIIKLMPGKMKSFLISLELKL